MKKIILLLLSFLFIENINAFDITDSFYYNDEKVENMWITRVKDNDIMSGNPYLLKRKSDNAFVYCLQPFVSLKQGENYNGYYTLNNDFYIDDNTLLRIRLLAQFGYQYASHNDIKWYGITQYLIWKAVEPDADIYFTDSKYGNRIIIYEDEIAEIENIINNYLELLEITEKKLIFNSIEEFIEWKGTNIFFKDITIDTNQEIIISSLNRKEMFFYHDISQNLYLYGESLPVKISFEIELFKEVIIRKWYGSGKYDLEEGATFEIYRDSVLIDTITTDKFGIAHISLPYGIYSIVQISGIDGYSYVEPFEIDIGMNKLNELIELYNEEIVVEVPDTSKNSKYFLLIIPVILFFRKLVCL